MRISANLFSTQYSYKEIVFLLSLNFYQIRSNSKTFPSRFQDAHVDVRRIWSQFVAGSLKSYPIRITGWQCCWKCTFMFKDFTDFREITWDHMISKAYPVWLKIIEARDTPLYYILQTCLTSNINTLLHFRFNLYDFIFLVAMNSPKQLDIDWHIIAEFATLERSINVSNFLFGYFCDGGRRNLKTS